MVVFVVVCAVVEFGLLGVEVVASSVVTPSVTGLVSATGAESADEFRELAVIVGELGEVEKR